MAPRPSPLSFRFEVDANAAFSVASLRCLRALSVSRAKRSRFEASYWDTADLSIRRHEAAIEISRIDEGRWIERIYARGPAGE